MKLQNVVLIGLLLLAPLATLSAQNSLPNPHDDSCWSSLSALRACQAQAYDEAKAYQQNCTSYPEYQCFDYYQPPQTSAKAAKKADRRSADSAPVVVSAPPVSSDSGVANIGTN